MRKGLFTDGSFFCKQGKVLGLAAGLLRIIGVPGEAGVEMFDLLLHIFYLFEDISDGVSRFLGLWRLFVVWKIDTGDTTGSGDRDLGFREIYFKQGID